MTIKREDFEEMKEKHYQLWNWLAANPHATKAEWPEYDDDMIFYSRCYCCKMAQLLLKDSCTNSRCYYCPLGADKIGCESANGLFVRWCRSSGSERTKLALQIRDLEWDETYVEKKKTSKDWRQKFCDLYYYAAPGKPSNALEGKSPIDDYLRYTNNYFCTEEEAKEFAEILQIEKELRLLAEEPVKPTEEAYAFAYSYVSDEIDIINLGLYRIPRTICFKSKKRAKKAREWIGDEQLKKYLKYNW